MRCTRGGRCDDPTTRVLATFRAPSRADTIAVLLPRFLYRDHCSYSSMNYCAAVVTNPCTSPRELHEPMLNGAGVCPDVDAHVAQPSVVLVVDVGVKSRVMSS